MSTNTLRASVTDQAAGINLALNPALISDASDYTPTADGGPDLPTLTWVANADLPAASPVLPDEAGAGYVVFPGPDDGAPFPPGIDFTVSDAVTAGVTYTLSVWVYLTDQSPEIGLFAESVPGTALDPTLLNQWQQMSVTFDAGSSAPSIALWMTNADTTWTPGANFYFTGVLLQPGTTVNDFTLGGGQFGDPVQVLVDGSDSPVTANGLSGYLPEPGDRLLVQRVGNQLEIVQFISRGTVPYLQPTDISDLAATVSLNSDDISLAQAATSNVNDALVAFQNDVNDQLGTFQGAYDMLTGVGSTPVQEDEMWVGDTTANTVKTVAISTYVQAGLSAPDYPSFAAYFNLWDQTDIGDITFPNIGGSGLTDNPPMTTFYNYLHNLGVTIVTGKDYGA